MRVESFLQSGDVLLYRPKGAFGWIIRIKTGHKVGHVEVYYRDGFSAASRDGKGVNIYPLRTAELFKVCRPKTPFNVYGAMRYYQTVEGHPYGWMDLAAFLSFDVDGPGIVCSPFAAAFLRAGGINPFNGTPSHNITPGDFDLSPVFEDYEVKDGLVLAVEAAEVGR
jgi:hypothetical protein